MPQKAHGQRFLDRQRLTRQEKIARKMTTTTNEREELLYKLALDQVYVAHHAMDVKYQVHATLQEGTTSGGIQSDLVSTGGY